MTFDLSKFMANLFGEMIIYSDGHLCLNAGYQTEDVRFNVNMAMRFQNCKKVLIEALCDFTNWSNRFKKAIDECSQSTDEAVTLYTWIPIPADTTTYTYGDGTIANCFPGKVLPAFGSELLGSFLVDYLGENFSSSKK